MKAADIKRQIVKRIDKIDDEYFLTSVLEMIDDFENSEDEEDSAEESNLDNHGRPDNKTLPPPVDQPPKNDVDSWLDTLGR